MFNMTDVINFVEENTIRMDKSEYGEFCERLSEEFGKIAKEAITESASVRAGNGDAGEPVLLTPDLS